MSKHDISAENAIEAIEPIAKQAGELLLRYYDKLSSGQVSTKSSGRDLLTVADSEAEALVIAEIKKAFPQHSILGEETGFMQGSEPYCWVIDPLDGTMNFSRSNPFYAVSIGLLHHGVPFAGVVNAPYLREMFCAAKGQGAYLNGVKLQVSKASTIKESLFATGFGYNRNEVERNNVDNFGKLVLEAGDLRRNGASSIDSCYVAAGRFDGYWEGYLKPWDVAAGCLCVLEAGGKVTDFAGDANPDEWLWHENQLCTNGLVHDALRAELSGHEPDYQPLFQDFAQKLK